MDFKDIASTMYPLWIMGIIMLFVTYKSKHKNLLRIDIKSVKKWIGLLAIVTLYRIILFSFFSDHAILKSMTSGAMMLPWEATLTVFWEDCLHTLPLVIIGSIIGKDRLWKKIVMYLLLTIVAISFGLGHLYQGYWAAFIISFYIPYTFKKGQEIGFGTIMICHTLYDFVTVLTIQSLVKYLN